MLLFTSQGYRKKICQNKFNNLLLLLWLFEVGASKKKRVGGLYIIIINI